MKINKEFLLSTNVNDNKSKTFCMNMFSYLKIDNNNNISICCRKNTKFYIDENADILSMMNNDFFKKLRYDMLNNIKNDFCINCYNTEILNINSERIHNNIMYTNCFEKNVIENLNDDYTVKKYNIELLDLRPSNKCNFKCRICNYKCSSSWVTDTEKFYNTKLEKKIINSDFKFIFKCLDFKEIKKIYLVGGETLIMNETYNILDYLVENNLSKNISLCINTNLSMLNYKNKNIINYKNNFFKIDLIISLDDIYKRVEYTRKGLIFDNIIKNIKELQKNNINYIINIVISIYNVYYILEILLFYKKNNVDYVFSFLYYPLILSIVCLPDIIKLNIINKLNIDLTKTDNNYIKEKIQSIINILISNLNTNDEENYKILNEFFDWNEKLDLIRNEKFELVFSELYNILKSA